MRTLTLTLVLNPNPNPQPCPCLDAFFERHRLAAKSSSVDLSAWEVTYVCKGMVTNMGVRGW